MARAANCPANTGGPSKGQRAPAALLKPDGSDRRRAGGSKGEARGAPPEKEKTALGLRCPVSTLAYFPRAHVREHARGSSVKVDQFCFCTVDVCCPKRRTIRDDQSSQYNETAHDGYALIDILNWSDHEKFGRTRTNLYFI